MVIRARENLVGAWVFLLGVVLAVLVGISAGMIPGFNLGPVILSILALLGFVVGYFVAEKDVQTFLFASVSLVIVSSMGVQGLVLSAAVTGLDIGRMISSIMGALLMMFVPATIIVALKTVFSISRS